MSVNGLYTPAISTGSYTGIGYVTFAVGAKKPPPSAAVLLLAELLASLTTAIVACKKYVDYSTESSKVKTI